MAFNAIELHDLFAFFDLLEQTHPIFCIRMFLLHTWTAYVICLSDHNKCPTVLGWERFFRVQSVLHSLSPSCSYRQSISVNVAFMCILTTGDWLNYSGSNQRSVTQRPWVHSERYPRHCYQDDDFGYAKRIEGGGGGKVRGFLFIQTIFGANVIILNIKETQRTQCTSSCKNTRTVFMVSNILSASGLPRVRQRY